MATLPAPDTDREIEQSCAGLPCIGVRSMTPDEREAVMAIALRKLRACGASLAIAAAIASWPFVLDALDYRAPDIGPVASLIVSLVAVLGSFISIAALLLRARDVWRDRHRFLTNLHDGTAIDFGGVVPPQPIEADQRKLVGAGIIAAGRAGQIAVLAGTRHVVYRDLRGRWQATPVRVRSAVAAPAYAMRVPVPRNFAVPIDPSMELVRRSLTSAERDEIRRYIHQVRRRLPQLLLFIPGSAICVAFLIEWLHAERRSFMGVFGPVAGLALLARSLWRYARVFRRTMLFSRDLAASWVLTLQPRQDLELEAGEVTSPSGGTRQEFLAVSGALWTQNGRPASWRDLVR